MARTTAPQKKYYRRDKNNIDRKAPATSKTGGTKTGGKNQISLDDFSEKDLAEPENLDIQEPGEETENGTGFSREKKYKNLPLVVIAGRPNVGKSTLFNRFLHKRCSITDPTPGVTRDPITREAFIAGYPVKLMDTGGFKLERESGTFDAYLDSLVVDKTLESLKSSSLILLLLEAGAPTAEDEEFIRLLRPYWNKVLAAVNKTEGGRGESDAWNYLSYGFNDVVFISAEHGDNISELAEKIVSRLDFSKVEEGEEEQFIRIALAGKPNTGKSTLSNRLTHSENSIVSEVAGTTRDVVESDFTYRNTNFHILDTAGIRRKSKVNENIEYYSVTRAIKSMLKADIVFHLIDAGEGLSEQDKKIIALAHEKGRGIIFCLNKWDTKTQDKKTFKKAVEDINIMFGHMEYAPVLSISAKEGTGIKNLLDTALELYRQLNIKTDTGPLNKALKSWLEAYPPPASRANKFKIRYMAQVSVNPVKFLLFVTRPEAVMQNYLSYIQNCIRRDLGYTNIPVQLEVKASRKKWEERT